MKNWQETVASNKTATHPPCVSLPNNFVARPSELIFNSGVNFNKQENKKSLYKHLVQLKARAKAI